MSKQSTKKLSAIITGLVLITPIGFVGSFNIFQVQDNLHVQAAENEKPDLTVESVDFSYDTSEYYTGQLNITICNRGDVSYNLNCDNDESLLNITRVGYFTSGISECGNIDINIDECREYKAGESFSDSGSYTFKIEVDPGDNINESNENNNILTKIIEINLEQESDLTPITLEINNTDRNNNESFQYGDIVDITIGIKNTGSDIDNEFYYTVLYGEENSIRSNLLGLDNGETYTYIHRIMWSQNNNQDITFVLDVDEKNNVNESDENNNTLTKTITIEEPSEITVTAPNGGEQWEKGKSYNISWDIDNDNLIGNRMTLHLSKEGDSSFSYTINPSQVIESTGMGLYEYSWTIPDWLESRTDYKIGIVLEESGGIQSFNDISDKPFSIATTSKPVTPTITQISLSQGKQGETVDVVITGSNLTRASNYSGCGISPVSSSGFELLTCNQISDTQINATFSIAADATVGTRNIKVQTPNGTSNIVTFSVVSLTPTPTPTSAECLPDDTLIKLPDDPKIYVIKNCKKKWIQTMEEFQAGGYNWTDVQETNLEVVNTYADYLEIAANLIRAANQARVYKIINNKKLWIPTAESFTAMGNDWSDIQDVQETEVEQYPRLKLAKTAGDEKVYYLTESGLKRHIPSVEAFNSYNNNWNDIVEISTTELNTYPDSILIRLTGDYKVYKLENNQKRWIKTIEAFNRLGLNWDEIAPVNDTELNAYMEGGEIE